MAAAFPELRDVTVTQTVYIFHAVGWYWKIFEVTYPSEKFSTQNSSLGGDDICFFWASETGRIVYVSFYIFCIN